MLLCLSELCGNHLYSNRRISKIIIISILSECAGKSAEFRLEDKFLSYSIYEATDPHVRLSDTQRHFSTFPR